MRKKLICFLLFMLVGLGVPVFQAGAEWKPPAEPEARVCYLINSDTGTVLYQKNAEQKAYPASMTKLMTAILTVQKYKDSLDTMITVENSDLKLIAGTGSSTMGLKAGEQLSVQDLLYGLLLPSGNDAAVVLARAVAGDVPTFVDMMNKEAKTLGCKNTHYVNPHGLQDTEQYTTAVDTYKIAREAMTYDILQQIVQTQTYRIAATAANQQHTLINTNKLLLPGQYYVTGAKGIKTGSTSDAGDCLVSYAKSGGNTYYCVVMGGPYDRYDDNAFKDTKPLLTWAIGSFGIQSLVEQGSVESEIDLKLAWNKTKLQLVTDKQFDALIPSHSDLKSVTLKPRVVRQYVMAPVKKGEKLGTADVMLGNMKLGTVNLVANESVARSQPLYFVYLVGRFFGSLWFKLLSALLILLLLAFFTMSFLRSRKKKLLAKRRRSKVYRFPR